MEQEPNWGKEERRSVKLLKESLQVLADQILIKKKENPTWIEWDEENWHYSGDGFAGTDEQKLERKLLYILALDAINFCFWPCKDYPKRTEINPLEYDVLAKALKELAQEDDMTSSPDGSSYAFSPARLSTMTEEKMKAALQPHLKGNFLDNMKKRAELWKEMGDVLLQHFEGSASTLLTHSNMSAPKLVELMYTHFPGFQDHVYLPDKVKLVLLKRAQIFVGDANAALKLGLKDMDQLTTFADYRVPQILRHYKVLEYSPALAQRVDSGTEIDKGSTDEVSIRAGTVVAVQELVKVLNSKSEGTPSGEPFTDVNVDWYLWQVGEKMNQEGILKPFHKVRTHFY